MKGVAILFARSDSVYKGMEGCDVWDAGRDARKWPGGCPVVAHPPCRAWGRLRHFAKPRLGEMGDAIWCVGKVRQWGGVLEHPSGSRLWQAAEMAEPGKVDGHGGWTMPVHQWWWGHRAAKSTWLYIVGLGPAECPEIKLRIGYPSHVVQGRGGQPHITKAERERTPEGFAQWLVELARRTGRV